MISQGVTSFANGVIHQSLTLYYDHAAHRLLPEFATTPAGDRPLIFFRGMLHFEPAAPYLETLRVSGYAPSVFRFDPASEANHLRQWRENTVDAVRALLGTALVEKDPVFVGHSAGGFSVYVLAALAKGADLAGLKAGLPGLADIPDRDLLDLALGLRRSRFIAVSAPIKGVHLTRLGRLVNRWVVEPRVPLLFTGITQGNVEDFYRKLRKSPGDVLDGNLVAVDRSLTFKGGVLSWASHAAIQGGMRLFSPFLDHEAVNDGIVPLDSACLSGPVQISVNSDHLKLVETAESARILVRLIALIEGRDRSAGDGGLGDARVG